MTQNRIPQCLARVHSPVSCEIGYEEWFTVVADTPLKCAPEQT